MSKTIITSRGEYPAIFCAAINKGILLEIQDERPLYVIAEEFDELESMRYENTDVDSGREFEGPLKLQMIQNIDDYVKQIRLQNQSNRE